MSYKKTSPLSGRIDGKTQESLRLHQVMKYLDLKKDKISLKKSQRGIVFLNFAVDEGVRRNKGRVGAKDGAKAIIQNLANLPVHFKNLEIFHGGEITCNSKNLEKSQSELGNYVEKIINAKALPIVIGGGHEITYGHYLGIKKSIKNKKIGIINFDAHFDIRPIEKNIGATSGTGFWQIANEEKEDFRYLALGIQKYSNTKLLFDLADKYGADYVLGEEFNQKSQSKILKKIEKFISEIDYVYLTICMDVFAACYAPGVSAPSLNGIVPNEIFLSFFDKITKSKKLIALDFAETNPKFDIDSRTSKLAASLIFRSLS